MQILKKSLLFLSILIIGFIALAIYWAFYRPLPDYNQTITTELIHSDVEVLWDSYGIPHITSDSKESIYFTIGYLHAQDRLWQMTLLQLAAEGRFAEFIDDKLIDYDRHLRRIGVWRTAKKIESELSSEHRLLLEAYSKGVNDFIKRNKKNLPIQFALTRMQPQPWTVTHSIALARLLAWELNISWWSETLYLNLSKSWQADSLSELIPVWKNSDPTTTAYNHLLPDLRSLLETELNLRTMLNFEGSSVGSNAWVVDGSKTDNGFPLLAGDPHLGFSLPGKWYEIVINWNNRYLSGATHPGAPVIIIGQNDFMAWSLTNVMADDSDFFIEKNDPKDRGRYIADSINGEAVYKSFEYERNYITLKSGEQIVNEIRYTQNGVIISDIPSDSLFTGDNNTHIAMRWTGNEVSNELGMLLDLNWANSFQQVQDLLPGFAVPAQNLMYADKTGNIAMFTMGKFPIRGGNPVLPSKGWDKNEQWSGYVPFNELPKVINPKKGWIANANNKISTTNRNYLSTFWESPSRIQRIEQLLNSKTTFSSDDFKLFQNDIHSFHAERIMRSVLRTLNPYASDTLINQALPYLNNWDYKYSTSATAATITDVFFMILTRNTLMDELGERNFELLVKLENFPVRLVDQLLGSNRFSTLWDDKTTVEIESADDIILRSMRETVIWLRDNFGEETYEWRWENLHTLTFKPPLFSQAAENPEASGILKLIVKNILSRGPYPVSGHGMSINNTQYTWDFSFNTVLGASIRRIVDLGDLSTVQTVIPGGQSGNPISNHFDDQIDLWLNGEYRTLIQDNSLFTKEKTKALTRFKASKK